MSRLSDEEKLSETAQLLQGVEPTEEYSLEDILAEFGQGAAEPAPEPAPKPEPTPAPEPEPDIPPEPDPANPPEPQPPAEEEPEPPAKPEPPEPEEAPEEEPEEQPEEAPEEEPPKISIEQVMSETVSAVLEETDDEILEEREPLRERAERLVLSAAERLRALRERRKKSGGAWEQPEREEPLEPEPDMDTAAREEKQRCRRLRKDLLHLSIPTALLIVLSVCDGLGFVPAVWQELDVLRGAVMGAGLLVSILLARPVWLEALEKLRARHIGCEAACAVVCAVCLAHCVFASIAGGPLPYAACASALLWASEYGLLLMSESRWESFRLADLGGAPPYGVSVTAAGACKQRGSLAGFYRTTVRPGPAERWQVILTPLLLTAATVLTGVAEGERPNNHPQKLLLSIP